MPLRFNFTPEGFNRATMTPSQEAVWLTAFANLMRDAEPMRRGVVSDMSPQEQAELAASKADLIASLVPLDTLPCHADRKSSVHCPVSNLLYGAP